MDILAAAETIRPGARALFTIALLLGTWYAIKYFFGRVIGGQQAKGGGSGGGEKNIVGVSVFLAAVLVGIMVATRS